MLRSALLAAMSASLLVCGAAAEDHGDLHCTHDRANCIKPAASQFNPCSLHTAIVYSAHAEDERCLPAHCNRPGALVASIPHCACATPPGSLRDLLARWETASARQPRSSSRQREWLERLAGEQLSAHVIDLLTKLTQPVNTAALQQDFAWKVQFSGNAGIALSATPRDDDVRLFCRELEIVFDRQHGIPAVIRVYSRTNAQLAEIDHSGVTTVSFTVDEPELTIPPSPTSAATPAIRFAAGTVELNLGPR